jgi:hypothetical protein
MKKFTRNSTFVAALVASMFILGSCDKELDDNSLSASAVNEAKTPAAETAQSIMIDIDVDAPVIEATGTWKFNKETALSYFTGGTPQNRNAAAQSQKCTFFNGGVLQAKKIGNVWITPVTTAPVAPKTSWDQMNAGSSAVSSAVSVDISIAGQSVVVNKGRAKYSFTLQDEEGNARISNLKVQVTGQPDVLNPAFAVAVGDKTNNCLADVYYTANAGIFGRATSALLTDMTMGEIIAQNAFSSTSACGNASIAKLEQLNYELGAGTYTVTVTGTVKGNEGMVSTPFVVSKVVTVGTCQ